MNWIPIEQYDSDIHPEVVLGWYKDQFFTMNKEHHYRYGLVWMSDSCRDFGGHETPTHFAVIEGPTA